MSRIINDYLIEFPEILVETDKIDNNWVNIHKPQINERWKILKDKPSDPILSSFINKFNAEILHEYTPFIIVKLNPFERYKTHIDTSRYAGINLIIRGNLENSSIDYYSDADNLLTPVFSYKYRNYPILMNGAKYHGVINNFNEERLLFSIYVSEKYRFEDLKGILIDTDPNYIFSEKIIASTLR